MEEGLGLGLGLIRKGRCCQKASLRSSFVCRCRFHFVLPARRLQPASSCVLAGFNLRTTSRSTCLQAVKPDGRKDEMLAGRGDEMLAGRRVVRNPRIQVGIRESGGILFDMRGEENPFKHYIEDPMNGERPVTMFDLTKVDQARAWMVYAAFDGDEEKAAIASKVPVEAVRALAHDYNWAAKLKRLKTGSGEPEAERIANRAVNYVQAQRMRTILEKSIELLEDEEQLLRALLKYKLTKEGDVESIEVSPKAVLELTKALEVVQNMSYRALGDKMPAKADDTEGKAAGAQGSVANVRKVINILVNMQERATGDFDEAEIKDADRIATDTGDRLV